MLESAVERCRALELYIRRDRSARTVFLAGQCFSHISCLFHCARRHLCFTCFVFHPAMCVIFISAAFWSSETYSCFGLHFSWIFRRAPRGTGCALSALSGCPPDPLLPSARTALLWARPTLLPLARPALLLLPLRPPALLRSQNAFAFAGCGFDAASRPVLPTLRRSELFSPMLASLQAELGRDVMPMRCTVTPSSMRRLAVELAVCLVHLGQSRRLFWVFFLCTCNRSMAFPGSPFLSSSPSARLQGNRYTESSERLSSEEHAAASRAPLQ